MLQNGSVHCMVSGSRADILTILNHTLLKKIIIITYIFSEEYTRTLEIKQLTLHSIEKNQ